jgi:hypothetical protein
MTKRYEFLYETDSQADDGYREIAGNTYEEAEREWAQQLASEGQSVRLIASQLIVPLDRASSGTD